MTPKSSFRYSIHLFCLAKCTEFEPVISSAGKPGTAPRLRELLIHLTSQDNYKLLVDLDKVGFLDSTGLGLLVGALKRVRPHDGWLDLICTQERILNIFRITEADENLRHLPDRGPGHHGQEVSNSRRACDAGETIDFQHSHPVGQISSPVGAPPG